jgi:hypothetical protein
LYDHLGATYRDSDADAVPIELALDHGYDGLVIVWLDGRAGRDARTLDADLARTHMPELLSKSNVEIVSSWTPSAGENDPRDVPMDLGSKAGGPERLCQLLFVSGALQDVLAAVQRYTDAIESADLATVRLVAPFFRTVVGTDTYADQLW